MAVHVRRSHGKGEISSKKHDVRIPSFVPGEIVLLVKSDQQAVGWMATINRWLNELSGQVVVDDHPVSFQLYKPDNIDQPTVTSGSGNSVTSLVQVLVDEGKAERPVILEVVSQLNERLGLIGQNITFLAASPNWLFWGATHGFGDGGPGGLPVPVSHGITQDEEFVNVILNNARSALGEPSAPTNPPVNVVILDTAYSRKELNDALNGEHKDHSLLKTLYLPSEDPNTRNPDSLLQVYEAKDEDLNIKMPPSPEKNKHYYVHKGSDNHEIKDHGLFVAGIIHSWAPNAKIHLFEVLNSYGVCTLTGLGKALEKVKNMFPPSAANPPLIVNCSFCITFPEPVQAQEQHKNIVETQKQNGESVVDEARYEKPETALLSMRSVLQEILDAYEDSGVCILAAAGNDAEFGRHADNKPATQQHADAASDSAQAARPAIRYPAAFEGVIGVGALDKNGVLADYSNGPDNIPHESMTVFGGKVRKLRNKNAEPNDAHAESSKAQGFAAQGSEASPPDEHDDLYVSDPDDSPIGIYLTGFLPEAGAASVENPLKGWAAWSGTSFATAMASGILARLASEGYKLPKSGSSGSGLLETVKTKLPPNLGSLRGRGRDVTSA